MFSYFHTFYRQLVKRGRSQRPATWVSAAVVIAVIFISTFSTAHAGGNLDPRFSATGKVSKAIGTGADRAYDLVVQPDHKIVVVGATFTNNNAFTDTVVMRFNSDGGTDPTFNFGNPLVINFNPQNDLAYAVALQADGKILISGYTMVGGVSRFLVARIHEWGQLDTSFGDGGSAVMSFSVVSNVAHGITTQMVNGEEKIVVVGSATVGNSDFAIARLNANGTPDMNFGTEGKVTMNINGSTDVANDVVIQRIDGVDRIVVAGYSRFEAGGGSFNEDFALVRLNVDGTPDTTFDTDGKVITNISAIDQARSVVIQRVAGVNKIVAGGLSYSASRSQFSVVRYNLNGSLDQEFNGNGRNVTTISPFGGQILDLVTQPDDRVVAAGFAYTGTTGANMDFAVARYNVDGRLDKNFGSCGTSVTSMAQTNGGDIFYGVGITHLGRVVAAGHTVMGPAGSNDDDIALVGYLPASRGATANSADFDGDGRIDVATYRPGTASWYLNCACAGPRSIQFGAAGDRNVAADYDGDGKADVAVFRQGIWYILRSSDNLLYAAQWGTEGDIPVQGDYDGDNRADLAVYRPSNSYWYVLTSEEDLVWSVQFGIEGDIPLPYDFDGNRNTNFAVFRPSTGYWYTSTDPGTNYGARQFGLDGDIPVPGDFDGDGELDLAVYRPAQGVWYLQQSKEGFRAIQFGLGTDTPIAGDFDGDTRDDIAVFRSGAWYMLTSTAGLKTAFWGTAGDVPAGK